MTLNFGRPQLSIPGPSIIPDKVLQAMHRPSPDIYKGELVDIAHSLDTDLRRVARTSGYPVIYICNGHGTWEAALANTCSRGDRVLVLFTGRFGMGWAEVAEDMGIEVDSLSFGTKAIADPAVVTERLRDDKAHQIKAVLTVQTDTSTSVRNDIPALRAAIDAANHPALLMVDAMASLGCERMEMDEWGVDVLLAGSQKGLMTPAGLGFLFFNDKADQARETADLATRYWDWRPRARPDVFYQRFCGTAPTHHLFGLRAALDILLNEEGIEAAWDRHARLARATWAALGVWSSGGEVEMNVPDAEIRSHAVTTVLAPGGRASQLRAWCEAETGVTLGVGLSLDLEHSSGGDDVFRIGHMGHLNLPMLMGTLSAIEAGLSALQIPHGKGALEAALTATT